MGILILHHSFRDESNWRIQIREIFKAPDLTDVLAYCKRHGLIFTAHLTPTEDMVEFNDAELTFSEYDDMLRELTILLKFKDAYGRAFA